MEEQRDIAIQIEGLKKKYRLGVIGGGTLQGDIQSWWARKRGKEDPNSKIGAKVHTKNEEFYALDGIDLTVYKGERLGIIGHNGAGKSTLLKLLSRVTAPTEGKICIDGRISSMLEVGTGFNGELTGRENIYMNGAILGMSKAEVDSKIEDIIEFSECRQFIDTPVKRYSSGMYVKLAFSVAAHLDNEIMIMDEVLAVGDMKFQQKCLGKMSDVSQSEGRTVLYVSHNMNTIRQLCNRCIVLDHGKMVFNGETEEAISTYLNKFETNKTIIDLAESNRPAKWMGKKLRLLEFKYLNNRIDFRHNEIIRFQLMFRACEALYRLRFRLEISYLDGTPIGIFESKIIENSVGINKMEFFFNPTMLPSGKYYLELDLYESDERNYYITVDHPVDRIMFEITDDEEQSIKWDHRRMGHARLGTIGRK